MDVGVTLFSRNQEIDDQDVWDDSALIEAYDRAVNAAKLKMNVSPLCFTERPRRDKSEVSISHSDFSDNSSHKKNKKKKKRWNVNDHCSALYHLDNLWYEADIVSINRKQGQCTVRFVGYGNEEVVPIKSIRPSEGLSKRDLQTLDAQKVEVDGNQDSIHSDMENSNFPKNNTHNINPEFTPQFPGFIPSGSHTDFPIPPPPLPTQDAGPNEALHSMLLAWYMSGYHTGYYHGLKSNLNKNQFK